MSGGGNGIDREAEMARLKAEARVDVREAEAILEERKGPPPPPKGSSIGDVIARWRAEGPVTHEPTGFAPLDEATGGGFVFGRFVLVVGAPDAGKTFLALCLAHPYAERGLVVGILAVDEDDDGVVTRLAQRSGYARDRIERRNGADLDDLEHRLGPLAIELFDASTTIEAAAARVAALCAEKNARGVLIIDSLDTVACDAELLPGGPNGEVAVARARAIACKAVARKHRLITFATQEMNRGGFRSEEAVASANDLAVGKYGGEFQAHVQLTLRNVKDEPNVLHVKLPKNKLRPPGCDVDGLYLEIDRGPHTLAVSDFEPGGGGEERDAAREERARVRNIAKSLAARAHLAVVLMLEPGLGRNEAAIRLQARGLGRDAARDVLAGGWPELVRGPGPRRSWRHYLLGARVPDEVLALVPVEERARVQRATPPAAEEPGS